MAEMKQKELVILRSTNGRDGWQPCKPEEVPDWVKTPENMGQLVRGLSCMKADEGEKGSDWYCARPVDEVVTILKAQEKRARRAKRAQHRVGQLRREKVSRQHQVKH